MRDPSPSEVRVHAVSGDRLLGILARLAAMSGPELRSARLCEVAAEVTSTAGAGIMLVGGDISSSTVCCTDAVAARIEELQFALGEGPCLDAVHQDQPVLEPDLADPATARWPAFAPPAVAAGVKGIFAFPLHIGIVRLGALDIYSDRPGPLSTEQYENALAAADVIARAVIAMQAAAPPGLMAMELSSASDFRFAVHQASGMVSVQLGVDVDEALVRIRAHAFADGRSLTDVADDIVNRRLRLEPGADPPSPGQ